MRTLLLLLIALLLSACIGINAPADPPTEPPAASPTAEPTIEASPTSDATATPTLPSPTITFEPHTATATLTPAPTVLPAENLALCWGFECSWKYQANDASLKVPLAWTAFWGTVPSPLDLAALQPRHCDGFKPAVELESHPPHRVEGMYSARVIQPYRACAAGLHQTIDVKAGYTYLASAMLFNWSTNNPVVDSPSTSYVRSWIGVDPAGGTDYAADSVVWSNEESAQDHFAYLEVKVKTAGPKMTLFLLSVPNYAVARSDSFWDLVGVMEVGSPPVAMPTPTPIATAGPIIEVTPDGGFPDIGIGVLVYDVITNLRECLNADVWGSTFDPTVTCPLLATDEGAANVLSPGTITNVWEWRVDRYANRWAWFGRTAAVACYKGAPRGQFYEGLETGEYVRLKSLGALPAPVNPCVVK